MKVLVIGHPDAVLGFSLAGVGGRVATNATEINQALDDVQTSKDVAIVLVTQDVAELIPARMEHLKWLETLPPDAFVVAPEAASGGEAGEGDVNPAVVPPEAPDGAEAKESEVKAAAE